MKTLQDNACTGQFLLRTERPSQMHEGFERLEKQRCYQDRGSMVLLEVEAEADHIRGWPERNGIDYSIIRAT